MWKSNVRTQDPRSPNSFPGAIVRWCMRLIPSLRPRPWQLPSWRFAAVVLATAIMAPVVQAQTCVYALNPTSTILLSSNGGSGFSTNVAIPTSCITSGSFTAKSNTSWIHLTDSPNASGLVTYFGTSATVRYNVEQNPDTTSRSGTITIAGKTFTVNQAGAPPCTYSLNPSSASIPAAGGSGFSVAVTQNNSPSGCGPAFDFRAKSNTPWIQLLGPANSDGSVSYFNPILGSGPSVKVLYKVNSNPYPTSDTGTITIAGRTFTVNQAGANSASCIYTLNPTSASIPAVGGTGFSVAVSIPSSCSTSGTFSAKSNNAWIHLLGTANPDGSVSYLGSSATVFYSVDANPNTPTDTGTITIASQTFTVNQAGKGSGASTPPVTVVEYYNASLDHYFITWIPAEIAILDAGTQIKGWVRTGQSFKTYTTAQAGTSPVCRFYIPPGLGDSHFFGRGTTECDATGQKNPSFVLEDPLFMHMFLPNLGVCPAGTIAIFRAFSNRPDANHRYMIDAAIRDLMVTLRWLAEGDGPNLVVMCAPNISVSASDSAKEAAVGR